MAEQEILVTYTDTHSQRNRDTEQNSGVVRHVGWRFADVVDTGNRSGLGTNSSAEK